MNKAWSLFWLVVACCIAASIIASWIAPHFGILVLIASLALIAVVGIRAYRYVRTGRRTY